jgi:hypothetical protein
MALRPGRCSRPKRVTVRSFYMRRVYRLYLEQGLAVRRLRCKRLVREQLIERRLNRANHEWAMSFIVDGLANGRMIRILSVVDAFTRECLELKDDTSLGSSRVTRELDRLIEQRVQPRACAQNQPEFTRVKVRPRIRTRNRVGTRNDERRVPLVSVLRLGPTLSPGQNRRSRSFDSALRAISATTPAMQSRRPAPA